MLRARYGDRALSRNEFRQPQRLLHHFLPAAFHDLGEETDGESFRCGEPARSVRELADEGVVASDLGEKGERADVGCEANVNLLCNYEILASRI